MNNMSEDEKKGALMAIGAAKAGWGCLDSCVTRIGIGLIILVLLSQLLKACGKI